MTEVRYKNGGTGNDNQYPLRYYDNFVDGQLAQTDILISPDEVKFVYLNNGDNKEINVTLPARDNLFYVVGTNTFTAI